jgi:hypothetical protein
MDWIFRLILENIWLIVFIIIGLSQFFTSIRTEKNRPTELPDSQEPPDIEELIRRIQEQERQQTTPPPLPTQTPRPQPPKNKIPQASKPHPDTLPSSTPQKRKLETDAFPPDAYALSSTPPPAITRPSSPEPDLQEISRELEHLRKQADAYSTKDQLKTKAVQKTSTFTNWRRSLQNPATARQAIILTEVLGAPRAIRPHSF